MLKETIVCNQCKNERKEANHWFVLVAGFDKDPGFGAVCVAPLNDLTMEPLELASGAGYIVEHLCGAACLQTRMSELLPALSNKEQFEALTTRRTK